MDSPREPERERTDQMGRKRRQLLTAYDRAGGPRRRRGGMQQLGRQRGRFPDGIDFDVESARRRPPRAGVPRRGARLGAQPGPRGPLLRPGEGLLR